MSYLSILQQMANRPSRLEAALSSIGSTAERYSQGLEQDRLRQRQREEQERQMAAQRAQIIQQRVPGLMASKQWDALAGLQGQYADAMKKAYDINLPAPAVGAPIYGPGAKPIITRGEPFRPMPPEKPVAPGAALGAPPSFVDSGSLSPVYTPTTITPPPEIRRDFSGAQSIQAMRNLFAPAPMAQPDLVLSYKPDGTATFVRKELGATIRPEPRMPATRMFQDYDPVTGRVKLVPGTPGTVFTPRPSMQLSYSPGGTQATVVPMIPGAQVGVRQPVARVSDDKVIDRANAALNNIEMSNKGAFQVIETTMEGTRPAFRVVVDPTVVPIDFIQNQFRSRGFNIRQGQGASFMAVAGAATRPGLAPPKPTDPLKPVTRKQVAQELKAMSDGLAAYIDQIDPGLRRRLSGQGLQIATEQDRARYKTLSNDYKELVQQRLLPPDPSVATTRPEQPAPVPTILPATPQPTPRPTGAPVDKRKAPGGPKGPIRTTDDLFPAVGIQQNP